MNWNKFRFIEAFHNMLWLYDHNLFISWSNLKMKLYYESLLDYLKMFRKQRTLSFYLSKNNNKMRNGQKTGWTYVFLLFNTNFIWMAPSYQIPHGLWNIIHLSPLIATRALSTFLYSLHILYIKHILVSRFIISFLSYFQSELLVPTSIPYSSHIHMYQCSSYFSIRAPGICLYSLVFMLPLISSLQALWVSKNQWYGCGNFFLLYLYSLCMYNIHLYTCIYLKIKVHLYFLRAQLVCKK